MPNSLAYFDRSIVKNLRTESVPRVQKVGRATILLTPPGYGNSLATCRQRGSSGFEEIVCRDLSRNKAEDRDLEK